MVKHLKETGMSYFQHMFHALRVSSILILAATCCIIHSVFPCLFVSTASTMVDNLNKNITKRQT